MAHSLTVSPPTKYLAVLLGSAFLWIVPISIKAPRIAILTGLSASIAGFSYCFRISPEVDFYLRVRKKQRIQLEEITNFQFALREEAIKDQLLMQQFAPVQTVQVQATPTPTQQPKALPSDIDIPKDRLDKIANLPDHLLSILECALESEEPITVREANRHTKLRGFKAEEVKAFFYELEQLEMGKVSNNPSRKDSLIFEIAEDLRQLSD